MGKSIFNDDSGGDTPFELLTSEEPKKDEKEEVVQERRESEDVQEGRKSNVQDQEGFQEEEVEDSNLEDITNESGQEEAEEQEEGKDISDDFEVEVEQGVEKPITNLLKERGYLPEDFEFKEGFTNEDLEEALVENLNEKARQEIRAEVAEDLRSNGVDPQLAELNKIKSYGVSQDELEKLDYYDRLSNISVSEDNENFDDIMEKMSLAYFEQKGFDQDDAKRYATKDLEEFEPEELMEKYKGYFSKESKSLNSSIKSKIEQGRESEQKAKAEEAQKLRSLLDKGEIKGQKYSKEQMDIVREQMFKKSEVVELPGGKKIKVTPLKKKKMELENDPEAALKANIDFILGHDIKTAEKKGENKGKRKFINELNKSLKVKQKSTGATFNQVFEPIQ